MIGGVIVSHGKLAEELLNALTIIIGEAVNIEAISIGWYDDVEESKIIKGTLYLIRIITLLREISFELLIKAELSIVSP